MLSAISTNSIKDNYFWKYYQGFEENSIFFGLFRLQMFKFAFTYGAKATSDKAVEIQEKRKDKHFDIYRRCCQRVGF